MVALVCAAMIWYLHAIGLIPIPWAVEFWKSVDNLFSRIFLLKLLPLPQYNYGAQYMYPIIVGVLTFRWIAPKKPLRYYKDCVMQLAGLRWDTNTFCRGWLILGATGSGKTEAAIGRILQEVTLRAAGTCHKKWESSKASKALKKAADKIKEQTEDIDQEITKQRVSIYKARNALDELIDVDVAEKIEGFVLDINNVVPTLGSASSEKRVSEIQTKINDHKLALNKYTLIQNIAGLKAHLKQIKQNPEQLTDRRIKKEIEKSEQQLQKAEARLHQIEHVNDINFKDAFAIKKETEELKEQLLEAAEDDTTRAARSKLRTENNRLEQLIERKSRLWKPYGEAVDQVRSIKYKTFPWGGVAVDLKGLFKDELDSLFATYERIEDLQLLQVRPDYASDSWTPLATMNLLSEPSIPPNTYADMLVETARNITGSSGESPFFTTQAQSNIGWGIRLFRAIQSEEIACGTDPDKACYPAIDQVMYILMSKDAYNELLEKHNVLINYDEWVEEEDKHNDEKTVFVNQTTGEERSERPVAMSSDEIEQCLTHFERNYWSQPEDQLGGVKGTIYTYLNYFANDAIAEIFCRKSTFQMGDIERGKVVCVSMPQKLSIERRYINTMLKQFYYTIAKNRFDLPDFNRVKKDGKLNLLICCQDEAQKFLIKEDGDADILRQAFATMIIATQQQPSLWVALGDGKTDLVKKLIGDLRNRIILRAASKECATESANYMGESEIKTKTRQVGQGSKGGSISKKVEHAIRPMEIQAIHDFHAYICHAGGKDKRRKVILAPYDHKAGPYPPKWWPQALFKISIWLWIKHKINPINDYKKLKLYDTGYR